MANRYLELAESLDEVALDDLQLTVVPPQSNATRTEFYERGLYLSQVVTMLSGESLRQPFVKASYLGGPSVSNGCDATDIETLYPPLGNNPAVRAPAGRLFAGYLGEARLLLDEAFDGAVRGNLAEADAERSRTPDVGLAMRAAWSAPVLSRARAAQLTYFGTAIGSSTMPIGPPDECALGELSERGAQALTLIRESGVNPDFLEEASNPTVLLEGATMPADGGVVVVDMGVLERLGERWDDDDYRDMTAGEFYHTVGLSEHDVVEARSHLLCELHALERDPTIVTEDSTAALTRYAAIVTPPTAPPPVVELARAMRFAMTYEYAENEHDPEYAMRGYAQAIRFAERVVTETLPFEGTLDVYDDTTEQVLAITAAGAPSGRSEHVEICVMRQATDLSIKVYYYDNGDGPALDDVEIVHGESGARCAVQGAVEGRRCSLEEYRVNNDANRGEDPVPPGAGYVRRLTLPYSSAIAPVYDFLVAPPAPLPSGQRPAGGYRVVAPIVLGDPMSLPLGETRCGKFEPEPKATETFDDAQEETPTTPSLPSKTCSGLENVRIPLETELTDDGDRYETSWRSQLRTALAAAELADRLGEEMISAGLDVDRRAEEAQSAIEQACGVTVNLGPIFNDDGTPLQANGGPCLMGNTCGTGYQCVGGVCLISAVERALSLAEAGSREHRVLAECLGAGDQAPVDLVSLGTRDLCVWRRTNDQNYACEQGSDGVHRDCPYEPEIAFERNREGEIISPAQAAAACAAAAPSIPASAVPPGVMLEFVPVLHRLRFFGSQAEDDRANTPAVSKLDCRILRRIRRAQTSEEQAENASPIIESNMFSLPNVLAMVRRLGWRGYPGDFSEATIDGQPWFSTGNPAATTTAARYNNYQWPCGPRVVECDPGNPPTPDGYGLFCASIACPDLEQRAIFNNRVAEAMVFLGVSSGYGLGRLELPTVYHNPRPHHPYEGAEAPAYPWHPYDSNPSTVLQLIQHGDARFGPAPYDFGGRLYELPADAAAETHIWTTFTSQPAVPLDCSAVGCSISIAPASTAGYSATRDFPTFAFANHGAQVPDTDRARRLAAQAWSGMGALEVRQEGDIGPLVWRVVRQEAYHPSQLVLPASTYIPLDPRTFHPIHELTEYYAEPVRYQRTCGVFGCSVWNMTQVASRGFTQENVLDALEILCEATRQFSGRFMCDGTTVPQLRSASDLPAVEAYVECLADRLDWIGEHIVAQNLPAAVVEGLDGSSAAVRPLEGEFGSSVAGARETLQRMREQPRAIASQLRGFSGDLEFTQSTLRAVGLDSDILDLQFAQQMLNLAAECAGAAAGAASLNFSGLGACGHLPAQIGLAFQVREAQLSRLDIDRQQAILRLRERFEARVEAFARIETETNTLSEQLRGHLGKIESSRTSARRALARAMFVGSTEGREHLNEAPIASEVNTALRRRYGTAQVRYRAAHTRAIRAAELARRAVEQRLGIEMSSLTRDMALVDAPSRWANLVCGMQGLNYARIRNEQTPAGGTGATTSYDHYAAEYVGDYVRNLQAVYDSYEYNFPYTDASDTAVVSLRDDVWNVRAPCSTPVYNLLPSTGDLLGVRDGSLLWRNYDCVDPAPAGAAGCITSPRRLEVGEAPTSPLPPTPGRDVPVGYRFTFNQGWTVAGQPLSLNPNSMFAHELEVQSGTYRVSWYGRPGTAAPAPDAVIRVVAVTGSVSVDETVTVTDTQNIQQGTWERFSFTFDVLQPTTVRIGVYPNLTAPTAVHHVDIAGLMLEDVSRDLDATAPPRDFVATDPEGLAQTYSCEDTDGQNLRASGWVRGCAYLCAEGFGDSSCTTPDTQCHPYWQREFLITQEDIEAGRMLGHSGFAYGNFNYRLERLALNFVGTASRRCDDERVPSTCYSTGYIPYTIQHLPLGPGGTYRVRNYNGRTYNAPLYVGTIEHGSGLAAERYITNPISSADRGLIEPYMRDDFMGRPIDGRYVLRVWDAPGVNFDGIEDIQLVLGYRYWSRAGVPPSTSP